MARPGDFATSDSPEVQAQLDRLSTLSLPQGRIGLEPVRALLAALGNPQQAMPPAFHIAGTNGKGSTCAFLRAALEASGRRVHAFTSPHLVRFNERIRLAGKLIDDELLAELLREVLDAAEVHDIAISFFEVSTAAAFLAFSRIPAEACVIEVGLGGRFDATNVLKGPAVCGIASLGIDHEAFLLSPEDGTPGEPMARIAFEKAGIAKPGTPLVTLDYAPAMNEAIAGQARRAGTRVLRRNRDWSIRATSDGFAYKDEQGVLNLSRPRLAGKHQVVNAGLAIAMLRHQSMLPMPDAAFIAAMEWVRWPARLQLLEQGPLTALLPRDTPCWLDGGHNPNAGEALALHFRESDAPIHLVIGMLANKHPSALLGPLRERLASVTVVPVPGHDCHGIEAFSGLLQEPQPTTANDVASALQRLRPAPDELVLIAGSLYLAGEVLRANHEFPD